MQEVIVYRNPAEAALWQAIGDGSAFPIIAAIIVFFITFLSARFVGMKIWRGWKVRQKIDAGALWIGAIAAVVTAWYLYAQI